MSSSNSGYCFFFSVIIWFLFNPIAIISLLLYFTIALFPVFFTKKIPKKIRKNDKKTINSTYSISNLFNIFFSDVSLKILSEIVFDIIFSTYKPFRRYYISIFHCPYNIYLFFFTYFLYKCFSFFIRKQKQCSRHKICQS